MIEVIPFDSLGGFRNDWLRARHHFSFGRYHDPARMGHGPLRVWNDDEIAPGTGFDPHPHRDMEIVTFVRSGAITHEDHLGNRGRTVAGDVQVMTAGQGIVHAEYNREADPTRIFQIWIEPATRGLKPAWATRSFPGASGGLVTLASGRPGDDGALPIHQDAAVLGATLAAGESATHRIGGARRGYIVAGVGAIRVNGVVAGARDGVRIEGEERLTIDAVEDSEIVLVDLP